MNRLRILKQRASRGQVSVVRAFMNERHGYVAATGKFEGQCSDPMSKRQAIQLAARWAMPSRPQVAQITQGDIVTRIKTGADGTRTVTVTDRNGRPVLTDYPAG